MPESTANVWRQFRDRVQGAHERLAAELTAVVADMQQILDGVQQQLERSSVTGLDPGSR